jgi:hypothetical protein
MTQGSFLRGDNYLKLNNVTGNYSIELGLSYILSAPGSQIIITIGRYLINLFATPVDSTIQYRLSIFYNNPAPQVIFQTTINQNTGSPTTMEQIANVNIELEQFSNELWIILNGNVYAKLNGYFPIKDATFGDIEFEVPPATVLYLTQFGINNR